MQKKKNKMKEKLNSLLSLVPVASADITDAASKARGVAKKADVVEMLLTIINYALIVLGVLAVAVFIYAGFLYLTAAGVQEKIDKAKNTLLYAVIGIVVAVLGFVAVATVQRFIVQG
ncbi:MAG: hypothetical protein FJZ04_00400 [Candidatus Moranbacteria bacterium]|nr:hypothetical protein [Candidatus Moranbacteria bacterium]